MKKAILLAIVVIIIAFLFFNSQARAYEPKLHIATSITEAETYESVLVMITSDPLDYQDNLTISSNHTIDLEFYNLGTGKTIYEGNVTLKYGTATWSFMVVPEWGEFTGIIKISDPLIDSEASIPIEISYSTDYREKQWTDYFNGEIAKIEQSSAKSDEGNRNLAIGSQAIFWTVLPIILLKFQHNYARKNNEDSYADRLFDWLWPQSETTSRLTMVLTDPNYRFPKTGLPMARADDLLEKLMENEEDQTLNLCEQEQIKAQIRKIDPDLMKSVQNTPDMSLDQLKEEMENQTKGKEA